MYDDVKLLMTECGLIIIYNAIKYKPFFPFIYCLHTLRCCAVNLLVVLVADALAINLRFRDLPRWRRAQILTVLRQHSFRIFRCVLLFEIWEQGVHFVLLLSIHKYKHIFARLDWFCLQKTQLHRRERPLVFWAIIWIDWDLAGMVHTILWNDCVNKLPMEKLLIT